jgi:hypothetical protein
MNHEKTIIFDKQNMTYQYKNLTLNAPEMIELNAKYFRFRTQSLVDINQIRTDIINAK